MSAWLTTIVTLLRFDSLCRRRDLPQENAGEVADPPGSGGDPEEVALLASELATALTVVLEALTPAQRVALVLLRVRHGVVNLFEANPARMWRVARVVLISAVSRPSSGLSDVPPGGVRLRAELSVDGGGYMVSTRAEMVADGAERDQESLHMLSRPEALEYPLALTRRQVRVFSPIVQAFMTPMLGVWQHPSNGRRIARELIGDDHTRLEAALALEHPMQEALGSHLIASLLDQDV